MSRTKPSAKRPIDERLAVANAILAALAEGGELQGEFTFDLIDEAEGFYGGDYYICDLATDLTHDRRRIASRLKKVRFLSGPIVVERAATFTDYREFATRFIHYFQIKTCNVLLKVEATINNLDWQGESPTPIYGYLHFHGSDRALRKDFDSIVKSEFKEAAAFSIRHLQAALSQLDKEARSAAANGVLSKLGKALGI